VIPVLLFGLVQLFEQLLFQIAARCFLIARRSAATAFLFRVAFSACPWLDGLRQVPDLRPIRANFSLLWFRVRIHQTF